MKRNSMVIFFIIAIALPQAALPADTAEKAAPPALELERLASQCLTTEEFGRSVAQEVLREGARLFKDTKASGDAIDLKLSFRVRRVPRPAVDPSSVDPCWETCMMEGRGTAISCYSNCNAPAIGSGSPPIRVLNCSQLRRELRESLGDIRRQRAILLQLIQSGCVDIAPVVSAIGAE
jgi:hypothetical protein